MNSDAMEREAFEKWAQGKGYRDFERDYDQYVDEMLHLRWLGWKARASLSASAEVKEGWKPIESAPKNGTPIDLWCGGARITDAYWGRPHHSCGEYGAFCDSCPTYDGWCDMDGYITDREGHAPTHWMPRPSAPQPLTSPSVPVGDDEAARRYIRDWCPDHVKDYIDRLSPTTEAVSAEAVKVKPIDWRDMTYQGVEEWIGHCALSSSFTIKAEGSQPEYRFVVRPFLSGETSFPTVDKAKAAAQADYERRILSALGPALAQGRDEPVACWINKDVLAALGKDKIANGSVLSGKLKKFRLQEEFVPLYLDPPDAYAKGWEDGREAAAKIAEGEVYHERYRTWSWWYEDQVGDRANLAADDLMVKHCDDIAAAIRALPPPLPPEPAENGEVG